MDEEEYLGYPPDNITKLLPKQIFVFGSNALSYHTGGASGTARKKLDFDFGKDVRKDNEVKVRTHFDLLEEFFYYYMRHNGRI